MDVAAVTSPIGLWTAFGRRHLGFYEARINHWMTGRSSEWI